MVTALMPSASRTAMMNGRFLASPPLSQWPGLSSVAAALAVGRRWCRSLTVVEARRVNPLMLKMDLD